MAAVWEGGSSTVFSKRVLGPPACDCQQVGGGCRILGKHADSHVHPVLLSQNLQGLRLGTQHNNGQPFCCRLDFETTAFHGAQVGKLGRPSSRLGEQLHKVGGRHRRSHGLKGPPSRKPPAWGAGQEGQPQDK